MPRCARCSGFGHEESVSKSDVTILVMELPDDDSEEEKCSRQMQQASAV